jgi:hypothetical protein
LVLGRLQELLKDYLTDSEGPEANPSEPGQRSVKLKLEMTRDNSQKTVRVLRKEKKKMIRLHRVMAYINSACERSQALLVSYFPFDKDDSRYERQVILTLKLIIKPLPANTDAATKIYVVSYPAVLGVRISKPGPGTGYRRGFLVLKAWCILDTSPGHMRVHMTLLCHALFDYKKGFMESKEGKRYFRRDTKYSN